MRNTFEKNRGIYNSEDARYSGAGSAKEGGWGVRRELEPFYNECGRELVFRTPRENLAGIE